MNPTVAKLRWRCRRGMRELDAVLAAFVDASALDLTPAEIAHFETILELPDPVLHAYLVGRSEPAEPAIANLIARIRSSHRPSP